MDIPLSGALFITNPRRKRRVVTRDNGAKDRFISRTLGIPLKRVKALKSKNYGAMRSNPRSSYKQLFEEAGGAAAFKKYKAKGKRTRKSVKSGTYSHSTWGGKSSKSKSTRKNPAMKHNPRTIWHKYLRAMKGKGYKMHELRAGYRTLLKKYPNGRGLIGAARKLKPKAHAAKDKKQRKAAAKSRAVSRLKAVRTKRGMRYFGYRNGKYGMISKADYQARRKLRGGKRRRPARASQKKGRSAARRTARKTVTIPFTGGKTTTWAALVKQHGVKKASRVYRSYGGMSANPRRRKAARRNPKHGFGALALRKNPASMLLGGLDKAGQMVADLPLVGGFFGPKIAPLGLGLAIGGIHFLALQRLGPQLPSIGGYLGGLLGKEEAGYRAGETAQKFGYTIGGVAVATALQAGRHFSPKFFKASTVNVLSTGALLVGAAVDFIDYMRGDDSSESSMDAGFTGDDMALNGVAYTGGQLNGVAYTGGQLNGLAYTGGDLNGAHMNGLHSLNEAYMRASFEDAAYSGADFDAAEGQAMLHGPRAYMAKFGLPAMRNGRRSGMSSMAGKHGHRWGWLVRMVGWERAAKLAAMSPDKRCAIINQLRGQAKMLVDNTSLNGLAYTGGELNGLAYTGGRV